MAFKLSIDTDNAAFEPEEGGPRPELARILRELANVLDAGDGGRGRSLRDVNGNIVGEWRLT